MRVLKKISSLDFLREANRWEELWANFLDWESRIGAFEYKDQGVPLWEYIRVPVFLHLQQLSGFLTFPRHIPLIVRLLKADVVKAALHRNPYWAPRRPILCVGIARRVRHRSSWHDPYLDPFLDEMPDSYVYCERPEAGLHMRPTRTKRVYYLDLVASLAAFFRRLGWGISAKTRRWLAQLELGLKRHFNLPVPLVRLGTEYLAVRYALLPLYRNLLMHLRPRVCIIVAINPAERALVEACRKLDIVTAEMQHGMIGPYDLTYTTPAGIVQQTFPDYMLLFGPFWRAAFRLPVPEGKAREVGFPFFQEMLRSFDFPARRPRLLVLSQPGYNGALILWTLRLARAAPAAYRITFRPHPAEPLSQEESRLLRERGVEVVEGTASLYELLASSTIQVGVFSTALYEGLAFGLKTYIVSLPGYQYMRPMFQRGWMRLLEDDSQPFDDRATWPRCDLRELFLFAGTQPFQKWLHEILAS